jgi:KaiC/GvpD/RAD55 family RecA-like ATPase
VGTHGAQECEVPVGAIMLEPIRQLSRECGDNWTSVARTIIALWRVLVTGRYLGSPAANQRALCQRDLDTGYAHHQERFERAGISREQLNAALDCLSAIARTGHRGANRFYLVKEGDQILCGPRRWAGHCGHSFTIPSITDMLSVLLQPVCGTAFVQNVLACDVREHYQLLDGGRDVASEIGELAEIFNRLASETGRSFAYTKLTTCLATCRESRSTTLEAFVEWLIIRNVVTQDFFRRNNLHRKGRRADASFLSNTLLGLYSGVPGLDYLFEGALRINRSSPLSMVIKGSAGAGKSSLALTYAAAWASAGALVQFATVEQGAAKIISLLKDWQLFHDGVFRVFTTKDEDRIKECFGKSQGAFLCGSPGYGLSFEDLTERFEHDMRSPLRSQFALKLLVLDSVNALKNGFDQNSWREKLTGFIDKAKGAGYSTILVLEDDAPPHRVDSFVVDTVVDLAYSDYEEQHPDVSRYQYRAITIEKARQQHTCRGEHLFRVRPRKGIRIYPSAGAMLATIRKPERIAAGENRLEIPESFIEGFLLLSHDRKSKWLREGTCTAIIGEGGTRKSALARAFSKAIVYGQKHRSTMTAGQASLLILFGQRFDEAEDERAKEIQITEHCRCYEVVPRCRSQVVSRELVLEFPSGYQTGSNVISEVIEGIEYIRGQQCAFRCAVLDDLDSMEAEHPVLADDEFFLPCLVQLLQSHNASVFLINRQPQGPLEKHDRKIQSLSQNVIRLVKVHEPGRDRIAIFVSKSSTGRHSRDDLELQVGPNGKLVILDGFRPYRDVRMGGTLQPIKIAFIAPAETGLQEEYYREINALQKAIHVDVTIHWSKPVPGLLQRALSPELVSTSGEVVVVACDNHDLPALVDSGYFEDLSKLLNYKTICECLGEAEAKAIAERVGGEDRVAESMFTAEGPFLDSIFTHLSRPKERQPAKERRQPRKKGKQPAPEEKQWARYQLPYYVNPAILVACGDFHDLVRREKDKSYTWKDLAVLARQTADATDQPMRLFECTGVSVQTYACFFIEVFLSLLDEIPPYEDGCISFCRCLDKHTEQAQEALRLVYDLGGLRSGNQAYQKEFDAHPKKEYPCVFRRQWYSTFREEAVRQMAERKECDFRLMPLPKYRSVLGDWHLCVVHGSVSPEVGAEFILRLCSDQMTIERMARGVGLTPKKKFYENNFSASNLPISQLSMEEYRTVHAKSIARSHIGCYRTLSQLMGTCLFSLLHEPKENVTPERIREFLDSLRGLFVPSTCPARHLLPPVLGQRESDNCYRRPNG